MVELIDLNKYICYPGRSADDFKNDKAETQFKASLDDRAAYFAKQAEDVFWHKKFTKVLDT